MARVAAENAVINQSEWDGYADRLWYLEESSKDSSNRQCYYLVNRSDPDLILQTQDGRTSELTYIVLGRRSGADYQQWLLSEYFEPVEFR